MDNQEKIIITKYDLLYEQRMTRVETNLENVHKTMDNLNITIREFAREMKADFRWIVIIMLSGFGTLFGLMAHGFKWFF